jgi:hypothetical protein
VATLQQAQPSGVQRTPPLSISRLNMMRVGYAFMAFGLILVKWPLLPDAHNMPLFEGVVTALLTAMSLLSLLGLRYPRQLLPVLLFESTWKILWLGIVALPSALAGDVDSAMQEIIVNCAFGVVILAITPWRYVWQRYATAKGDPWR